MSLTGRAIAALGAIVSALFVPSLVHAESVSVQEHVLQVVAAPGESNRVDVSALEGDVLVTDRGAGVQVTAGPGCVPYAAGVRCAGTGLRLIDVSLADGYDTFSGTTAANAAQWLSVPMHVDGGDDNDFLAGGLGPDVLNGGPGDDGLSDHQPAELSMPIDEDTFIGGSGNDGMDYRGPAAVFVSLDGVANDGRAGEHDNVHTDIENLSGSWVADTLVGNDGDNRLHSFYSSGDTLIGLGGDDVLDGGSRLEGGAGKDVLVGSGTLLGGPGDDQLVPSYSDADDATADGGDGVDTLDFTARNDVLTVTLDDLHNDGYANEHLNARGERVLGGWRENHLVGDDRSNVLEGGQSDDVLEGGGGTDVYRGGDGTDTASWASATGDVTASLDGLANDGTAGEAENVGSDIENLEGGRGDDHLSGGPLVNVLSGGPGDDWLGGGPGHYDRLNGEAGDDTLEGGAGHDFLDGGPGLDVTSYADRSTAVAVDLVPDSFFGYTAGNADDQLVSYDRGDALTSVEGAIGGAGGDVLNGDAADNVLIGGLGDDRLDGRGGDDELVGGPGKDIADYSSSVAGVLVTLDGTADDGTAIEYDNVDATVEDVVGSSHDDLLIGNAAANVLDGRGGDDALAGLAGPDQLIGNWGLDAADYSDRTTPVVVTLNGRAESGDASDGAAGARDVVGTDVEAIWGGAGDDRLIGNAADNLLNGGPGADALSGGSGEDVADYSDRTTAVTAALDGTPGSGNAEDGSPGQRDTLGTDIEDLIGGTGPDELVGNAAANVLAGLDGDDSLSVRDGTQDLALCGGGSDRAVVDAHDETDACENVVGGSATPQAAPTPTPTPTPMPRATPEPAADVRPLGRQRIRDLVARGLRVEVECTESCTAKLELSLSAATARRFGLRTRSSRVVIGRRSARLSAGTRKITIATTANARKRLRKAKKLTVTITARVTFGADPRSHVMTQRLTLRSRIAPVRAAQLRLTTQTGREPVRH